MSAASAAAALIAISRKRVITGFREQGAETPGRAVAFQPQRRMDTGQFKRLVRSGVVKEAAPGRYWLDNEALAADLKRQRRAVLISAIVITAIFLLWIAFNMLR